MRTTHARWLIWLSILPAVLTLAGCGRSAEGGQPPATGAVVHQEASAEQAAPVFGELSFPAGNTTPVAVKVPVLMYHHVGDPPAGADELRRGLTVGGADFAAQMDYLKQAGYQPVSMRQLFEALYYGGQLPEKPVLLTLDDGYLDNYTVAAPILGEHGFTATFYIITGMVGQPEYMNWEQVVELERRGMEIGSHTVSHPDLSSLAAANLATEVGGSAAALAGALGHPVYWFCYPAGRYDDGVIEELRQAGYLLATTTEPGETHQSDAPFMLPRYRVRPDTGVEGVAELVR